LDRSFKKLFEEGDIKMAWEGIRGNIKILAKKSVHYYQLEDIKTWFAKNAQNLWIEEGKLNCKGCRIWSNVTDILNNERRESTSYFGEKRKKEISEEYKQRVRTRILVNCVEEWTRLRKGCKPIPQPRHSERKLKRTLLGEVQILMPDNKVCAQNGAFSARELVGIRSHIKIK
jgi:hypothetical protein